MSFTETTRQGFFSRLIGSFVGLLLGPLVVVGAIWLLTWNEGRAVQAIVGLGNAAKSVIETTDAPLAANEGKLVHVVAPATATDPIADGELGITFTGDVAVNRIVEMYQWKEHKEEKTQDNVGGSQTTTTTYTYDRVWSEEPIDSTAFKHPEGHLNAAMPFTTRRFDAGDAKLGGYRLDDATLGLLTLSNPLQPNPPQGWKRSGDELYKSVDPSNPAISDLRVRYSSLPSGTTLSVLAAQSRGGFAPYVTSNGYTIALARTGNSTADQMIADKRKSESTVTWILRGVGALVMFIGFFMFFGPLATVASVLPLLSTIVRGAAAGIAIVLTIPLTLVTIAIAWLAFRPLIGAGLLALAAIAIYALWRWHRTRSLTPVGVPKLT